MKGFGLSALASLAPYHVLSYGTLLGTQLFQTFVITKVTFRSLPMPQFVRLQKRLFPLYFQGQALLMLLTAATYPPMSLRGLVRDWPSLACLSIGALMSGINLFLYGPQTSIAMMERLRQDVKDAAERTALNRRFKIAHAMSLHFNLIAVISTVVYGLIFSSRIAPAIS